MPLGVGVVKESNRRDLEIVLNVCSISKTEGFGGWRGQPVFVSQGFATVVFANWLTSSVSAPLGRMVPGGASFSKFPGSELLFTRALPLQKLTSHCGHYSFS